MLQLAAAWPPHGTSTKRLLRRRRRCPVGVTSRNRNGVSRSRIMNRFRLWRKDTFGGGVGSVHLAPALDWTCLAAVLEQLVPDVGVLMVETADMRTKFSTVTRIRPTTRHVEVWTRGDCPPVLVRAAERHRRGDGGRDARPPHGRGQGDPHPRAVRTPPCSQSFANAASGPSRTARRATSAWCARGGMPATGLGWWQSRRWTCLLGSCSTTLTTIRMHGA